MRGSGRVFCTHVFCLCGSPKNPRVDNVQTVTTHTYTPSHHRNIATTNDKRQKWHQENNRSSKAHKPRWCVVYATRPSRDLSQLRVDTHFVESVWKHICPRPRRDKRHKHKHKHKLTTKCRVQLAFNRLLTKITYQRSTLLCSQWSRQPREYLSINLVCRKYLTPK